MQSYNCFPQIGNNFFVANVGDCQIILCKNGKKLHLARQWTIYLPLLSSKHK